jgi:hypothetical protein
VEAEAANDQLGSIDGAALTMELDANYDNLGTVPWHTACPGIFATSRESILSQVNEEAFRTQ